MEDTPNIFVTKSECKKNNIVLSKFEVMNSIPTDALNKSETESKKIEWRWRLIKLPHKKNEIIEISYKKPDDQRMFINKSGKWVHREIDDSFNQFITKEYYLYSD